MQKKKAISLIVLVITIIVMIILAGAIILSLNNSGIIDKASEAVDETDLATVKELAQMAWGEAYIETDKTQENLDKFVREKLGEDITKKYVIDVTTKGVTVKSKGPWKQQGLTVTNGTVTLAIGDTIAYDETNGGTITGLTATDWKVLGASEDGELLIMSSTDICTVQLGEPGNLIKSQNDWLNAPTILDALCEPYGKGEGATGVRSITVEDVNKVTGYDPETAKYDKGTVSEYGNEVTYSYAGSGKIKYYSKVTAPEKEVSCTTFYYWDKTTNTFVKADLENGTGIITKIRSSRYYYQTSELETIEYDSAAYSMIYGENTEFYWLASTDVSASKSTARFGVYCVEEWQVGSCALCNSNGNPSSHVAGVRAVVSLLPNGDITGSSADGWKIN